MTEEPDPPEIFATFDDEYAGDILVATKTEWLSANELSEECDMSRPTVSRRVTRLVEQGLLETPALARLYAHILQHGPVTVSEMVDELDIPQGTAYDYVQNLETAGLVEKTREQRPYKYDAVSIALTLSTDGKTQTITLALIAAVARRDRDEAIDVYIERHGLDGLAVALEYAYEYVEGTVNHRIAARELERFAK